MLATTLVGMVAVGLVAALVTVIAFASGMSRIHDRISRSSEAGSTGA